MPDSGQPSTATGETLPKWRRRLKASIGEDPARYLDRDLASGDGRDLALARIRGLARIEVVRAWVAAERRLADRDDREPRGKILDLLEEREADLQAHGERPRDLRAALEDDARSVPDRYWPSRGTFDEDTTADAPDYPDVRERFRDLLASRGIHTSPRASGVLEDARTTETTEQAGLTGYATDGGQPDEGGSDA